MDFVKQILFLCVVFKAAPISSADDEFDACVVQYLKARELNKSFQWNLSPMLSGCPSFDADLQSLKSIYFVQTSLEYPGSSFCLIDKFDNEEAIDYVLKVHMIIRRDNGNETQLMEETRSQFKNVLKQIAVQCAFDDRNFIKVFSNILGIQNETAEAYQHEFCLAKYAIDNNLVELKGVDTNPHHIDPESVNCTGIIDIERNKLENQFREKVSALSLVRQSYFDTVKDSYKNHKGFDWQVAFKFLNYLDIHSQVRE